MAESNLIRLSGLWAHEQEDGSMVLTGNLGGARVVVLPIRDKSSSQSPDYALYIGPGNDKSRGQGRRQGVGGARTIQGH